MRRFDLSRIKLKPCNWAVIRACVLPTQGLKDTQSPLQLMQNELFSKVLELVKPDLVERIRGRRFFGSEEQLEITILKYFLRASSNPVPRQLFSGYSKIPINKSTIIKFEQEDKWLATQLSVDEADLDSTLFFNSHLYFVKGALHLKQYRGDTEGYKDVALSLAPSTQELVHKCVRKFGAFEFTPKALRSFLKLGEKDFSDFLHFLKANQIVHKPSGYQRLKSRRMKFGECQSAHATRARDWELNLILEEDSQISQKLASKVASATTDLIKIYQEIFMCTRISKGKSRQDFIFESQLSDFDVPLVYALSKNGLGGKSEMPQIATHTLTARYFQDRATKAILKDEKEVLITNTEINHLVEQSTRVLSQMSYPAFVPHSSSTFFEIVDPSADLAVIKRVEPYSFLSPLGRYARYDKRIFTDCVNELAKLSADLDDDCVFATLSYHDLSHKNDGIIVSGSYGIPRIVVNQPCLDRVLDLPLDDIFIKMTNTGPVLRSKSLKKQIILLHSNMLNKGVIHDATLDFLQDIAKGAALSFNPFSFLEFVDERLPRISFPSAIVHLAKWRIKKVDLEREFGLSLQGIEEWMRVKKVPNQVETFVNDSTLGLDLTQSSARLLVLDEIKRKGFIILQEIIQYKGYSRRMDLILPMLNSAREKIRADFSPYELKQKNFQTGKMALGVQQGLFSFHVKTSPAQQFLVLKDCLAPFIFKLQKKHPGLKYFFIFYTDDIDGTHIRIRFSHPKRDKKRKEILNEILQFLEELRSDGHIEGHSLRQFVPEYGRFHGQKGFRAYLKESELQSKFILEELVRKALLSSEDRKRAALEFSKHYSSLYVSSQSRKQRAQMSNKLDWFRFSREESKLNLRFIKALSPRHRYKYLADLLHLVSNRLGLLTTEEPSLKVNPNS